MCIATQSTFQATGVAWKYNTPKPTPCYSGPAYIGPGTLASGAAANSTCGVPATQPAHWTLGHSLWALPTGLGQPHGAIPTGASPLGHPHGGILIGASPLGPHHWGIPIGASPHLPSRRIPHASVSERPQRGSDIPQRPQCGSNARRVQYLQSRRVPRASASERPQRGIKHLGQGIRNATNISSVAARSSREQKQAAQCGSNAASLQ